MRVKLHVPVQTLHYSIIGKAIIRHTYKLRLSTFTQLLFLLGMQNLIVYRTVVLSITCAQNYYTHTTQILLTEN